MMHNTPIYLLLIVIIVSSLSAFNCNARPTVKDAQKRLIKLGYDPGSADGIIGPKTEIALREFQRDHGLNQSGRLDPPTIKHLGLSNSFIDILRGFGTKIILGVLTSFISGILLAVVPSIRYRSNAATGLQISAGIIGVVLGSVLAIMFYGLASSAFVPIIIRNLGSEQASLGIIFAALVGIAMGVMDCSNLKFNLSMLML